MEFPSGQDQVQFAQQQMIQQSMEESDEEIPYVDNQQMLTTDQGIRENKDYRSPICTQHFARN